MKFYPWVFAFILFSVYANAQRPIELRSENIQESQITTIQITPGSNVSNAFHQSVIANYSEMPDGQYLQFNIPKGTYKVPSTTESAVFKLTGKRNVIINGNGSTIICLKPLRFFESNDCTNIIFKNFIVDHDPVPFTQGTIQEVNNQGKYINVTIDEGYDNPVNNINYQLEANGGVNGKLWLFVKDPTMRGMMKRGCSNVYTINKSKKWITDPNNSNQVRIFIGKLNNMAAGDKWCMPLSLSKNLVRISRGDQITVEDLTQYSGAGALMYGGSSRMLNFIRVKSMLKPNTDRILANTRDGSIFSTNSIGPLFEDCHFEANGDDGINMNISNNELESIDVSNNTVGITSVVNRFGSKGVVAIDPGDTVVFYSYPQEKEYHRDVVTAITKSKDAKGLTHAICVMKNPVPADLMDHGKLKTWNICKANPFFIVRGCTFRYLRRHGMFLYGRNGIIENNRFERNTYKAIETVAQGRLGYLPENVIIRNNTFIDNNITQNGYGTRSGAPVIFCLEANKNDTGANKPIKNIHLKNNTFKEDFHNKIIYMTNCQKTSIKENRFQSYDFSVEEMKNQAVEIVHSDVDYNVESNTFTRLNYEPAKILAFTSEFTSSNSITLENGITAAMGFHDLKIDGNRNITISKFGNRGYFVPDSIAMQLLGSNARTFQIDFKLDRDINSSDTEEANILQIGTDAAGKFLRLFIDANKRIGVDFGGGKIFMTASLSKDFSSKHSIQLAISSEAGVTLAVDNTQVAWSSTPENLDINTSKGSFYLFRNNQQFGGVTIYTVNAWNYKREVNTSSALVKHDRKVICYPNPVDDILTIQNINNSIEQVKIFNLEGKLVYTQKIASVNKVTINCSSYTAGTYVLQLYNSDNKFSSLKFQKR